MNLTDREHKMDDARTLKEWVSTMRGTPTIFFLMVPGIAVLLTLFKQGIELLFPDWFFPWGATLVVMLFTVLHVYVEMNARFMNAAAARIGIIMLFFSPWLAGFAGLDERAISPIRAYFPYFAFAVPVCLLIIGAFEVHQNKGAQLARDD